MMVHNMVFFFYTSRGALFGNKNQWQTFSVKGKLLTGQQIPEFLLYLWWNGK